MSWNCNNTCHVITTNHARRIIAANSPLTLPLVEFIDLDGSRFRVNVSDAPCLKIVIDLKDGGGNVLQDIGILIDNLATVRNTTYSSDALQQVRCNALCPVPFSVQLSSDVELIVCEACNPCCCPESEQKKEDSKYLMLIAFFLGLLLLLFFLSLLCYFWRQWYPNPCGLGCSSQSMVKTGVVLSSASVPAPVVVTCAPVVTEPSVNEMKIEQPLVAVQPCDCPPAEQQSVVLSDLCENKVEMPPVTVQPSDLKPVEQLPVIVPSDLSVHKEEVPPVVVEPSDMRFVEQPIIVPLDMSAGKVEVLIVATQNISDVSAVPTSDFL